MTTKQQKVADAAEPTSYEDVEGAEDEDKVVVDTDKWPKIKFNPQPPFLITSCTMDAKSGADTGDPMQWKPFSLTYVEYQEGDLIGLVLAASSLVPIFIVVSALTTIFIRRDLHSIAFFVGLTLNYVSNAGLKLYMAEERPRVISGRSHFNRYGMPSTHAQFMAYVAAYQCLFVLLRLSHKGGSLLEWLWKFTWCAGNVAVALAVIYGRVYLYYHTVEQVVYGAAFGSLCAAAWFALTHWVLSPALFPYLASTRAGEFLLLRDLTDIPHVVWFEYVNARNEALKRLKSRQRRMSKVN